MSNMVISVENLSKVYRLGQIGTGTMTRDLQVWWATKVRRQPHPLLKIGQTDHGNRAGEDLYALRDVSFTVEQGEVLGIIGRNGAGKSTLLKILSRVTAPTSGQVKVKGRIASLLEVGTGFHPELTGRENIYLNGAILGMHKAEITRKFDEIVAFAEIEQFLDTPVKRYSSGMYVRLAFAVAAHLEPEILLVDEVLAVGDAAFQKKCLGKMGDVARHGRTVLFVSHNMGAVSVLCTRAVVIHQGQVIIRDTPDVAIGLYLATMAALRTNASLAARTDREGNRRLRFTSVRMLNADNQSIDTIRAGEKVTLELQYELTGPVVRYVQFQINFFDSIGRIIFTCFTKTLDQAFPEIGPDTKVACEIPVFPLAPGTYSISVTCYEIKTVADRVYDALQFDVVDGDFFGNGRSTPSDCGSFMVKHSWKLLR